MRINKMLRKFSERKSGNILTLPNFTCVTIILLFSIAITPLYAGDIYNQENLLNFYRYDKTQPLEASFDTTGGGIPEFYVFSFSH